MEFRPFMITGLLCGQFFLVGACGGGEASTCSQVTEALCDHLDDCLDFPYGGATPDNPNDDVEDVEACRDILENDCIEGSMAPSACIGDLADHSCGGNFEDWTLPVSCDGVVDYAR